LVRIAATPEFGALVAREFFPQAAEKFPKIRLVMSAAYAFEDLQDPAFDLGIRIGSVRDERLVARHIGGFRRVLVASPAFIAKQPVTSPHDLAALPCLCFSDAKTESTWVLTDSSQEHRISVSGPFAVRSFTTVVDLAIAGAGIAYVPDFLAHDAIAAGRLSRCLPGLHSRSTPVHLVYRPSVRRVQRVKVILELAMSALPSLLSEPARS
jgi:DNA-binding transcriptional LysR family regulator